ncbi:MAG TPA: YdeI/OmpD-associated family protein [Acidimicrobiia bacterium]|nr:YdeI/OmpD-associated family protein [Acidimicrobiia bacterium]
MTSITLRPQPDSPNGKEVLTPATRAAWRAWLAGHGGREEGLWVVYRKKSSELEGPLYDDLVEEALCFGWIDSRVQRVDDERRMQWFSPRRRGGVWSSLNKTRVERLIEDGLMAEAGQRAIEAAVADGSWSQMDEVDALVIPPDVETALDLVPGARAAFDALPAATRKQHLWWIHSAKRAATRSSRIDSLIGRLSENP